MDDVPWYTTLWTKIRYICTCCRPEPTPQPHETSRVEGHVTDTASATSGEVSTPIRATSRFVHLEKCTKIFQVGRLYSVLIFSILNRPYLFGGFLSFYLSEMQFSGFLQLKRYFVPGQNVTKYCDCAP